VIRTHLAATLDQGHDGLFPRRLFVCAVLGLATDERHVTFDNLILAADWRGLFVGHRFADAVCEKPC
jgi:hypothetical protein